MSIIQVVLTSCWACGVKHNYGGYYCPKCQAMWDTWTRVRYE